MFYFWLALGFYYLFFYIDFFRHQSFPFRLWHNQVTSNFWLCFVATISRILHKYRQLQMAVEGPSWSRDQAGVLIFWSGGPPPLLQWLPWSTRRFVRELDSNWNILWSVLSNFSRVYRPRNADNFCVEWADYTRRLQGSVLGKKRQVAEITMVTVISHLG